MEEIINSVMQSPENTNPNVLRGQLQKIGGGSGGGVFVVGMDAETAMLDKTAREIMDAMLQKSVCLYVDNEHGVAFYSFAAFEHEPNSAYVFSFIVSSDIVQFSCQSENDYPGMLNKS